MSLLFLNTVTFALTVSIGALIFAILGIIVFFVFHKGGFLKTAVLLLNTLVIASVTSLLIYKYSSASEIGSKFKPLYFVFIALAVLCLTDCLLGQRVKSKTSGKKETKYIAAAVCIFVALAYAVCAFTVTGGLYLQGTKIAMVLFPKAGDYILEIEADGDPLVVDISSQTFEQSAKSAYNQTKILAGGVDGASFTVPEDVLALSFTFNSEGGTNLHTAAFGKYRIPIRYPLLPGFVERRVRGTNMLNSITQRLVYFQDGLKLFRRSPIIGLGIGAYENAIKSVQSFYYETKYVHNHYFQTMMETGVVGLLLFLFLLISSAAAIWKSREEQPLAPMLGAVWFFMAVQALHDIVFSAYVYLPLAYGSFIMFDLCCGECLQKPKLTRKVKIIALSVISTCTLVYGVFLAGNLIAKRSIEQNPSLETLVQCVRLDKFEWADYALPYVASVTGRDVETNIYRQADAYAERLSKVDSNTIPIYLAEYYFSTYRTELGFEMAEKYVDYVSSDQSAWQRTFDLLRIYDDGSETFGSGVVHIAEKLDAWNENNLGTIKLNETTVAYVESRGG